MRNFLQPINRLPPEVLALCAAFVPDTGTGPRPLILLTHVCRYWREAITSSPGTWARISSRWKRYAPFCLEHARAAPLSVEISSQEIQGDKDFIQALIPHTSKISHLSVTGYSSVRNFVDDHPDFLKSPMPHLTSLEFQRTGEPAELFPRGQNPLTPLFQHGVKLKSLHLTGVPLFQTQRDISSLVELTLACYTATPRELLGFLESNPALEIVDLDLKFTGPSVTALRMVSLPRLRSLALSCEEPPDAGGFLSCLSITSCMNISIEGKRCADLATFLPDPPTPIQHVLTPITIAKYTHTKPRLHLLGPGGSFSFSSRQTASWELLKSFSPFVIGTIREVHLDVGAVILEDQLPKLLEQLPALEALAFCSICFYYSSLSALKRKPILCPSLKTIAFLNCRVDGEIIKMLEEAAAARKNSTATPLYRVVIVSSEGGLPVFKQFQKLQGFVP